MRQQQDRKKHNNLHERWMSRMTSGTPSISVAHIISSVGEKINSSVQFTLMDHCCLWAHATLCWMKTILVVVRSRQQSYNERKAFWRLRSLAPEKQKQAWGMWKMTVKSCVRSYLARIGKDSDPLYWILQANAGKNQVVVTMFLLFNTSSVGWESALGSTVVCLICKMMILVCVRKKSSWRKFDAPQKINPTKSQVLRFH